MDTPLPAASPVLADRPGKSPSCSQGRWAWTSGPSARFGLGPYLVADGKLVILNEDGVLTMAKASTQSYLPLGSAKILDGPDAWAPMALAAGRSTPRRITAFHRAFLDQVRLTGRAQVSRPVRLAAGRDEVAGPVPLEGRIHRHLEEFPALPPPHEENWLPAEGDHDRVRDLAQEHPGTDPGPRTALGGAVGVGLQVLEYAHRRTPSLVRGERHLGDARVPGPI